MTEYRTLCEDDEAALISLWRDALDNGDDQSRQALHDFGQDSHWAMRTFVAVRAGEVIASAKYWTREMRDAQGQLQRVGHVLGVATRQDARRQGHAMHLLNLVIDAMRTEGCAWSVLFARPEAAQLYGRLDWQAYASPWQLGPVTPYPQPSTHLRIESIGASNLAERLEELCNIYAAFNSARPLSVVRNRDYWQGYATWMLNDWMTHHGTRLIVATSDDAAVGYAIYNIYPPHFVVSELGVMPDHPEAATALLNVIAHETPTIAGGRVLMPSDPLTDSTLRAAFGDQLQQGKEHSGLMAKPLTTDADALAQAFEQPTAYYWPLDGY